MLILVRVAVSFHLGYATTVHMDRRRAERITATLRCFITHPALPGGYIPGFTVNLSRAGVLLRCPAVNGCGSPFPAIGDIVEIDMLLPNLRADMQPRCLHCFATVNRISADLDGTRYFAAAIHEMHFRDLPVRLNDSLVSLAAATERVC